MGDVLAATFQVCKRTIGMLLSPLDYVEDVGLTHLRVLAVLQLHHVGSGLVLEELLGQVLRCGLGGGILGTVFPPVGPTIISAGLHFGWLLAGGGLRRYVIKLLGLDIVLLKLQVESLGFFVLNLVHLVQSLLDLLVLLPTHLLLVAYRCAQLQVEVHPRPELVHIYCVLGRLVYVGLSC